MVSRRFRAAGHALALTSLIWAANASFAGTGKHPTLVDPASAKCATCHDEVTKAKVKHAPVEADCLSCHDFAKKDGATTVKLTAEVPGLCLACHDALTAAAEGKLKASHAPVADCGNCHKPHGSDEAHLLNASPRQVCAACHTAEDVNKGHPIPVSRADCLSCHLPHGGNSKGFLSGTVLHAPFLDKSCAACHRKGRGTKTQFQKEGGALCYACHADVEKSLATGVVHTAVKKGQCTGCHDPHVAGQKKLLKAAGNDLCFPCHAAIRDKVTAAGAHAPAKKSCSTCHEAHRSENRAQLVSRVPGLCLKCHPANDKKLAGKHLGADLTKLDCTTCHDPHGSKQENLIAGGSVHAPFEDGCDSCHVGATTKLVEKDSRALCLACHGDVAVDAGKEKVTHAAMEGECTACHSPHASAQKKLVKAPGGEVCTACHEDQQTKEGHFEHGAIGLLGCQSCHLPHGGANPKMVRATGNDLCNGCHLSDLVKPAADGTIVLPGGATLEGADAAALKLITLDPTRTKNHPQPGHPVAGVAREGSRSVLAKSIVGKEIGCSSCHSPHSGRTRALFSGGVESHVKLCLACHPR